MASVGSVTLARIEAAVYRVPADPPVRTAFGTMHDRPAVIVRVEDGAGNHGWGEVFCNWPPPGAEHRARLVAEVLAPLVQGRSFDHPAEVGAWLEQRTRVLVLQCDEPGPFAQAIAGIDGAVWDMAARKAGLPLAVALGGRVAPVPAYASGINPDRPERMAAAKRAEGYGGFKLKIGFGRDRDLANLAAMRAELGADARLMADANQAWTLDEAARIAPDLAPFGLFWLEEPVMADTSLVDWQALASVAPMPLAAGENMRSRAEFAAAIASGAFGVVQPDAIKWGGVTGCAEVGRTVVAAGLNYCPHFLSGGIGLMASAHILAAVGGPGMLEVDANENPLRTLLARPFPVLADGRFVLTDAPGIGVEPDLVGLERSRHSL
ncbi:L-alanine-DL-glutamate epimerase-like enolase superfamily enzyme [Stella humosa]|uniref:L-alanine-DL-glutamate epimerase-like enolase superfamily enzyme n=1 Tax=Stella humosa TaxID=94 RepID=A0A3N1KSA9_9PROT|nr:mandelate racemase/muconate lactonizing enzyme family protein [Stella humosa]ROP81280.1 L-alanine-DL-glutamate epimerase-like enolase superfamily enzyme [Stella humosa]BBK32629.1 mandelate racemase [Stella humosa]